MDSQSIINIASTVGIISTTTFWAMNLTMNHIAFPAVLLGGVPKSPAKAAESSSRFFTPSTDTPESLRPFLTRQWHEIYMRGYLWGPPSAIISGASLLTAAYYSGPESTQRYLYLAAAIAAMSVMPWTLSVMIPINNELVRRADSERLALEKGEPKEVKGDGRDLVTLIRSWVSGNEVRAYAAMVATGAAVTASLL